MKNMTFFMLNTFSKTQNYRALGQQERGMRGERSQEKNQKFCVTMLVDIKLYVYCNSSQKEKKIKN